MQSSVSETYSVAQRTLRSAWSHLHCRPIFLFTTNATTPTRDAFSYNSFISPLPEFSNSVSIYEQLE